MANSSNVNKTRFDRFLLNLAARDIWNLRLALFAFVVYFLAVVTVQIFPNSPSRWPFLILAELLAYFSVLVAGLIVRVLSRAHDRAARFGAWQNLSLFVLLGVLKNGVGSMLIYLADPFDLARLLRDLTNGAIAGLFIGLLFVVIYGSQLANEQTVRELRENQRNLEVIVADFDSSIERHTRKLIDHSQKTLAPLFEQIYAVLASPGQRDRVKLNLEQSIKKGVAPLVEELDRFDSNSTAAFAAKIGLHPTRPLRLPVEFQKDSRPLLMWLAAAPSLYALMIFLHPPMQVWLSVAASLIFPILTTMAMRLRGSIGALLNRHAVFTAAAISLTTGAFVTFASYDDSNSFSLFATWFVSTLGAMGLQMLFLLSSANERSTEFLIVQLREVVAKLNSADHALHRNMWVVQRRWANILHGRVQALLTSCLIEITSSKATAKQLSAKVEGTLAEAKKIIENGLAEEFDFGAALHLLIDSWMSVCSIDLKISKSASAVIAADQNLAFAANTILKEVVSKCYSSFGAKAIKIRLDMNDAAELVLVASGRSNKSEAEADRVDFSKLDALSSGIRVSISKSQFLVTARLETIALSHA
jgi:hypothetical protein